MPGLADYVKKLDEYTGRLDDYVKGKPLNLTVATAVEALKPLVAIREKLQAILVASPPVPVPVEPETAKIDFEAILREVKTSIVAEYGKYENVELSPENEFMIWAHAQRRALQSEISAIDEALEWNIWLKPICDAAFLHVVGDEPVRCGCKTCQQSDEEPPCYDGEAPQTLEKCNEIKHVLRKLKIPYEAGLYMVYDERKLMQARAALNVLRARGYQIQAGDIWMRRAWSCGALAPGVVERLT